MNTKGIYLLVEGDDDKRLLDHISSIFLTRGYSWIKYYQYACKQRKNICCFIKTLNKMEADYLFLHDLDDKECISKMKVSILEKYSGIKESNIVIVKREIESWYLAGISDEQCASWGYVNLTSTNDITKEKFNNLIPKRFQSRIDYIQEILKSFELETAIRKNNSFDYFHSKCIETT